MIMTKFENTCNAAFKAALGIDNPAGLVGYFDSIHIIGSAECRKPKVNILGISGGLHESS